MAARHNYFYPPFPFPPIPDPYFNPYYQNNQPYYQHNNGPWQPQRRMMDPRYSAALDVDAEVVDEADELLEQMKEEEEWMADRERAQMRKNKGERGGVGDAIPLKSAAAYASDLYEDENKFQGRKPGQPVNIRDRQPHPPSGGEGGRTESSSSARENDLREQHVILDDYDNFMMNDSFFQEPLPPQYRPPPRRSGPSVYTPEEEALIAAMGGRGQQQQQHPRSTQEFAGLGTMTNERGVHAMPPNKDMAIDPQQLNYNPEQNYNRPNERLSSMPPPPMPMMPPEAQMFGGQQQFREDGFLGDSTLKEISLDYGVPIPYLADVLAGWGTPVPIDPDMRLGDMVTGEQAFAVLEAIHTLDIAELHERYSEENLMNICDYYDIDLKEAFEFCVEGRGWALPFGVRTFLRVEQEEELLDALCGEGVY